jgi:probable HAF family extracellular repeat protein
MAVHTPTRRAENLFHLMWRVVSVNKRYRTALFLERIEMRHRFVAFFNAALTLAFLATPLAATGQTVRYHVQALPEAPGAAVCVPTSMNAAGDVVGYCNDDSGSFAVVWRGGIVTNLGKWSSGTFAEALGINSTGQIVGKGDDGGDFESKALMRVGDRWIQIDGSGGSSQQAYGITDDGVIFGNYTSTRSPGFEDWDPAMWTWDAANQRYERADLQRPQGTISGAFVYAVTKGGIAVGQVASDAGNLAGLWNNDASHSLVVLGNLTGFNSAAAFGVSDEGHAVGAAYFGDTKQTAVLWQNDGTHTAMDLGTLDGFARSEAHGVNSAGQVVGFSSNPLSAARGFLYQNGTMAELTSLVDPTDAAWTINEAFGINNAGQIIAMGTREGQQHPVMLVPFVSSVSSVTMAADRTAPQVAGTTVTFTASAAGGVAPVQFRFSVHDGSISTVVQDWSASASFTWTPSTPNASYTITVAARSAGNTQDVPESVATMAFPIQAAVPVSRVSSVTLTANKRAPEKAGTSVTFTASATAGAAPVEFKFRVFDGTAWTVARDWSTMATFSWTPTAPNSAYRVSVWARSSGVTADAPEASAEMAFAINGKAPKVKNDRDARASGKKGK